MPVEPIPCAPGGGGEPVEVTTCCAPSIASAPLCLADGTTILAVVRSGCVECGADATDPEVVGWLDTAGAFTAGALPADAGPCDAGCLDTICRQRCDDLDGDGQADATYSELYCVRADGTAELVLTYQDDPTVPYTPVSPVECTYGCAESETVTLCDDSGPFLRRYSWLAGVGSFEDVDLDGQTPHVVTGTVGACGGDTGCEEQTTPAATLGLCLADGTPIAVVVTRSCDGTVTQDGWLNLTTGAYSAGDPPLGVMACGNPRSISTTGTFCDVDPDTGDVLGLVLIEYTYGPDGDVAAVRLVDATTGQTYTPQGEVTTCPAGVEQPERDLVQLCDTADDGTVTEFVRDYARDETGQITGHSDYLLDGSAYTPAGTVGRCAEQCRDSSSTLLCDTAAQEAITVLDPANRPGADGWEIVSFTGYGPGYGPEAAIPYPVLHPAGNPTLMGARSDLSLGPNVGGPWSGYEAAPVRWVMRKTFTAPEDGIAVVSSAGFRGDGGARVRVNNTDAGMYGQWNQPATTGTAQIPVTAGPNIIEIEVRDVGGPNWITGRLDVVMTRTVQFMRRTVVDCETGETVSVVDTTLDGEPYEVTGEVGQCEPVAECCEQPPPETRVDVETRELCLVDDETGAVLGRVLVERLYDDQNGERLEQRYVDPVTGDPVTPPAGASVAVCPPEPCRDTYTTQVCDLPTGDPAGVPTATDTSATPYPWDADPIRCVNQHPGGGQSLWDGGTVTIPARASGAGGCTPNQWLAGLAATLQAPRPSCDSGTVTITVAVAARNNGPAASAANYAGSLRIHRADTGARLADSGSALGSMPAGTVRTMTATAVNVPAGLLAAGQIVVALDVESWDQTGNTGAAWLLSNFVAGYEFQQDGCETQFLRKIVTDCETGETVSVTDTTLDGEPYTVTGEVGQCTTLGSGEAGTCCDRTEVVTLCSTAPGGEVTPFLRHLTYPEGSGTPTIRDTLLDGTEYVPDGEVGTCAGSAAAGEGRDVELTEMCVVNNGTGTVVQRILAEVTYDTATGERLSVNYVDPATWGPVAMPGGTHLDVCPPAEEEPTPDVEVVQLCDLVDGADPVPFLRHLAYLPGATAPTVVDTALDGVTPYVLTGTAGACSEPCAVRAVVEACRCDDTDGDGLPDTGYVELLGVDCAGQLTSLGTYTDGLTEPYTPVSPVDCATVDDEEGAEPAHGVQARRVDLAAGASWDAAAVPALQSVTAVAHGGTGTITTADGPSTLRPGESVTWSVVRDVDAALTGPLTITTVTGTVTVSWTQGVTL